MNSLIDWASAKANPLKPGASGQGFLEKQAMAMAKSAICKADISKVKQRLRTALDTMPDAMVASMIQGSAFCQSGGKARKTRKQKRKTRKTRKH